MGSRYYTFETLSVAMLEPSMSEERVTGQLNEFSDEMATKRTVLYYSDAREALIKALGEF